MSDFRHYCASCGLRAECEHTFGAFFAAKSANGTGCNYRIHSFDLERVKKCAEAVRHSDVAAASFAAPKPDVWHTYIVATDDGREFTTVAKSEAQAINQVLFKHFENAPISRCPGFSALLVQKDCGGCGASKKKPSKADILKRLNRMTKGR